MDDIGLDRAQQLVNRHQRADVLDRPDRPDQRGDEERRDAGVPRLIIKNPPRACDQARFKALGVQMGYGIERIPLRPAQFQLRDDMRDA